MLLPVVIDGTGDILPKHGLIFDSGHHIKIRVLDPVYSSSIPGVSPEELALKLSLKMSQELKEIRTNK